MEREVRQNDLDASKMSALLMNTSAPVRFIRNVSSDHALKPNAKLTAELDFAKTRNLAARKTDLQVSA